LLLAHEHNFGFDQQQQRRKDEKKEKKERRKEREEAEWMFVYGIGGNE